eukprot:ANDGO_04117.mRNA.1 hypothetical protein
MRRGRQHAGEAPYLLLMFGQIVGRLLSDRGPNRHIPWVTLGIACVCFAVYTDDFISPLPIPIPIVPDFESSLFCPFKVASAVSSSLSDLQYKQTNPHHRTRLMDEWRTSVLLPAFGSVFHHVNIGHLLSNMGSLLHSGVLVEDLLGSWPFFLSVLLSIPCIALVHTVLSWLLFAISSYNEFYSCGIGLSGVLFAMMTLAGAYAVQAQRSRTGLWDLVAHNSRLHAIAVQIAMLTLLDPTISFVAHASGFIVGIFYVWVAGYWSVHYSEDGGHRSRTPPQRRRYVIRNGRLSSY